mmetsp:Transcript_10737/g.22837  ORF Transcript_10737/g.22837 Transcript_10737/m.22837 type:complete len:271 (-) Transcript_10737:1138-1950(-)
MHCFSWNLRASQALKISTCRCFSSASAASSSSQALCSASLRRRASSRCACCCLSSSFCLCRCTALRPCMSVNVTVIGAGIASAVDDSSANRSLMTQSPWPVPCFRRRGPKVSCPSDPDSATRQGALRCSSTLGAVELPPLANAPPSASHSSPRTRSSTSATAPPAKHAAPAAPVSLPYASCKHSFSSPSTCSLSVLLTCTASASRCAATSFAGGPARTSNAFKVLCTSVSQRHARSNFSTCGLASVYLASTTYSPTSTSCLSFTMFASRP